MTAHEEDAQVVDVEHGQTVIRLGFHLIDFGMARELTSCQLDGFLMNWCSRDHVDQPRFAQLDRLHHIVQRHLPRQFLHLAPFDTVAIVVASFQNIQRPQLKRASCGWAILWIAKSQPMIFIARLIIGTEPIRNGLHSSYTLLSIMVATVISGPILPDRQW